MSLFSKQIFYCRSCGSKIVESVNAPYKAEVCNQDCWKELEWKRTLSIMGKEYYPRTSGT